METKAGRGGVGLFSNYKNILVNQDVLGVFLAWYYVKSVCFVKCSVSNKIYFSLFTVSALKPEEMPEVRMDTEERQSAGYEVYHQKLV